jgi:ring-1,2-phenylacetyl-CoA epoxidase subunit PaaD
MNEIEIWNALNDVKDPEIPVVSLVEMGIVRDVMWDGETAVVTITPTFAGCPALQTMRQNITTRLHQLGIQQVHINTVVDPPWSSDWLNDEAREKLRQFGLAPPPRHNGNFIALASLEAIACPRCGNSHTTLKNAFGSTLCRAIWYCHNCQDAFEQFKPL